MKISLVATPVWATKTPPLTISYLKGWLERHGHDVIQLDWNIELHHHASDAFKELWDRTHLHKWQMEQRFREEVFPHVVAPTLDAYVARILRNDPEIVGISVYSTCATRVLVDALKAAKPDLLIVCGGQVCDRTFYGKTLAQTPGIDVVVMGEGEGPLLDIVNQWGANRSLGSIPGCLINRGDSYEDCGDRAPVKNVNDIGWPSFETLPMDWYTSDLEPPFAPSRSVSTLMSRGCVRKCDFCLQAEIWQNYRFRKGEDIYEEMRTMTERYGLTSYHFNDLLINGSVRALERMCDLLIERPLGISWGGNAIVSRTLTRRLLEKMKLAGCSFLGFGFESFSTPVLKAMGKKYDTSEVERVIQDLRDLDIRFFSNLIIGHPSESRANFSETIEFLIRNQGLFDEPPTSSLLIVQQGTPIWRARDHYGIKMNQGDALGWWLDSGGNDLTERKYRAQVMNFFYQALFRKEIKITDMDREELSL